MIGSVPDKILDNNGLYMRLKLLNNEQSTEISSLRERIAVMEKELDKVTIRCDIYKYVSSQFYAH
jgi:hypothetical protein